MKPTSQINFLTFCDLCCQGETHLRLNVHQTQLIPGQHAANGLQTSAVLVFLVLSVLNKPKWKKNMEYKVTRANAKLINCGDLTYSITIS